MPLRIDHGVPADLSPPMDDHLILRDETGQPLAQASLWYARTPLLHQQRIGYIGHYQATTPASAQHLLQACLNTLRTHGCQVAIGPIDGDTWHRYRFILERRTHPIFFLEPDHPDSFVTHFLTAGFTPCAHYFSSIGHDLTLSDPRLIRVAERLSHAKVELRQLRLDQFEEELCHLHSLCLTAFADHFLYTPISLDDFRKLYLPLQSRIRPELVQLAEYQGKLVGFLFALPDYLAASRQHPIDTLIIKTVAVDSHRLFAGLGQYLVEQTQHQAHRLGFSHVIHALMHESNRSLNLSAHYTQPMRRYALFSRSLRQ